MIKQINRKPKKAINKHPLIGKKFYSLFQWFLQSYFPSRVTVYSSWSTEYFSIINKLAATRGKREALNYNKLLRLSITRYLSGEPLGAETLNVKLNQDGLASCIYFLHPTIKKGEREDLRIIFTMMNLTRGVILEPVDDFKSIIDPWGGNHPNKWEVFSIAVKRTLGLRRFKAQFQALHTSTKSGPNGQAMLFSIQDYLGLPSDLKDHIKVLGGPEIEKIFALLDKDWSGTPLTHHWLSLIKMDPKLDPLTRKLSTFGDKEGKTRVIGILDYWSQTVLRPIHKSLEGLLRKIPEDCTFDQNEWYTKLPRDCVYYSFDLSNATDRLPIKHQKLILIQLIGKKKADAWEAIMTNYEFLHKNTDTRIKYGAGQPMGAYSSWPIMALQHHCLIVYSALLCGVNPSGKYVVLGDDVVIADTQLANKYTQVMAELDVPISKMKTHKSKEICEFAKRWYYRGSEITAFPLHSISNNLKRYYLLQNSLEDAKRKGYILDESHERGCVIKLISLTGKKEQAPRIYKLYKLFDAIVSKEPDLAKYHGNIMKIILANWKVPPENLEKYFADLKSFEEGFNFNMEEFFLDLTSEGNIEMMDMMDQIKKWKKSSNALHPDLWNDLQTAIPIISSFTTCWKDRTALMTSYYKVYANDKSKLRASLTLLGTLPCTSTKIINTRSAHQILAAHSRLVKMLLSQMLVYSPPPETEEDWIAQMKTIHSNDGDSP